MTPSHRLVLGRVALEWPFKREAIAWATERIGQGAEGTHLYLLAGLTERDRAEDVWAEFRAALEELGLEALSGQAAIRAYACELCRQILEDQIPAQEGHQVLYQIWLEAILRAGGEPYSGWMYLDDSLDLVRSGHGPLEGFEGLTPENYPVFVRREAERFLRGCR